MSNWQNGLACVILSHIPICLFFLYPSWLGLILVWLSFLTERTDKRYDGICCILNFEDEIKNIAIYVCLLCWTARGPGTVLAGQKHISQPVILEGLNMTVWQTDINKTNCGAMRWLSLSLSCLLHIKYLKESISQPLMLLIMVSEHTLAHLPVGTNETQINTEIKLRPVHKTHHPVGHKTELLSLKWNNKQT